MEYEIVYIEGDSMAYVAFIKAQGEKAVLTGIDGKQRWVVEREDGSKFIARPMEAKPNEENTQ